MDILESRLAIVAEKHGIAGCAVTQVTDLVFRREFRDACTVNACGYFGSCWMCPPDVGGIDELIAEAKSYKNMFVYQTIGQLEDSFDFEGMQEAAKQHNATARFLSKEVAPLLGKHLHLCAGACHVCEVCAKRTWEPCRFPDEAVPSLESYGVDVSELALASGLKYINGTNTVTFFGGFLYG